MLLHQQRQPPADRRGKRQRMEHPSEALAHALLETVRQVLDDGEDFDDDGDILTAPHIPRGNHHGRRPLQNNTGAVWDSYSASPMHMANLMDHPRHPPEPDSEPVAYVSRMHGKRHEEEARRCERPRHWPTQLMYPELPPLPLPLRPAFMFSKAALQTAWPHDPAAPVVFHPAVSELHVAAPPLPAPPADPASEGSPSLESTHTSMEPGKGGDIAGSGCSGGSGGATCGDLLEHGNEGRSEPAQTSTDDGCDRPLHRKKHSSPKAGIPGGPCAHCGTTESPQWRRPLTKKVVLCNACGIYFSRHHSLPKRKKLAGGCSQTIVRPAKPAAAAAAPLPQFVKQEPLEFMMCEEQLEEGDAEGSPVTEIGALDCGLRALPGQSAPAEAGRVRRGEILLSSGSGTMGQQAGQMPGRRTVGSSQPVVRECVRLSLPLMTSLPVLGGINFIVQTFLNPTAASF